MGAAGAIAERVGATGRPDCELLFHVNGKPLGPMVSELQRTCAALGIPYGRGKGIVFHDTRHSAVTNLVGCGAPETIAMTTTGHTDRSGFTPPNVRPDDRQADPLTPQETHLPRKPGATATPPP